MGVFAPRLDDGLYLAGAGAQTRAGNAIKLYAVQVRPSY